MAIDDISGIDLREKLAHIDLMLAQHQRIQQETLNDETRLNRLRQEMLNDETRIGQVRQAMQLAPWQVGFAGMTAGAALFAAGAAFIKLMGG